MHRYPWANFQAATTFSVRSTTTAATITSIYATKYARAIRAVVTPEGGPIRFGLGGLTPSASNGHWIDAKDVVELEGSEEIRTFAHRRAGATSATLWITLEYQYGDHPTRG